MGTLYIDKKEIHVKLDGDAIAFYEKGEKTGIVPLNPLKTVIITGNVTIDTSVLKRLADLGIYVIFLSGKRMRFCGSLRGKTHKNGFLRLKQYEKSLSKFSLEISKELITKKINNQKEFLTEIGKEKPEKTLIIEPVIGTLSKNIVSLLSSESLDTVRGLEGSSSSAYFSAYIHFFPSSLNFTKRTKRPPLDPVNAMLSLCYTRVHYELVREIEISGLDPTIGFYHQFEYGRESLACDLVEVFRTEVDRFVYRLFRDRDLTARDFAKDDERPGVYLKKSGRKKFYPLYETWSQTLRSRFREEVRNFARRIMDGKDPLSE